MDKGRGCKYFYRNFLGKSNARVEMETREQIRVPRLQN